MIKLQIVGNLGKDCIVKEVSGRTVINFSVVHSERYKDNQGNPKERATWVECAYWTDKTAIAPYLKKGQLIYAEGSPEADAYMNKENQAAATLRMRVQSVQLLGGSKENSGQNPNQNSNQNSNQNYSQNSGNNAGSSYSTPSANTHQQVSAPVADDLPF
ncbi:MAG: single-stranded DNA-binding protein [Ferruginibacter sp.]